MSVTSELWQLRVHLTATLSLMWGRQPKQLNAFWIAWLSIPDKCFPDTNPWTGTVTGFSAQFFPSHLLHLDALPGGPSGNISLCANRAIPKLRASGSQPPVWDAQRTGFLRGRHVPF